ncbi:MAG: NUDIX hydrolase [Firmicutes bacterium]|nr:NUDIX hydrolase [Bacillota bacterium]
MSKYMEKLLASKRVFVGKVVSLRVDTVELPGGREGTREVVEYPGAVAVVAVNGRGEVYLVRQYRHAVGMELLEIPAGKMEKGEEAEVCARRELLEETGCEAREVKPLLRFFSTPGFTTEEMHLFLASGLTEGKQNPDDDEFIDVEKVPLERALEMVWSGQICDAKSVAGILAAYGCLKGGRQESFGLEENSFSLR